MSKQLLSVILVCFSISILDAQNIDKWISSNEKIPAEKIYVHTDAENYFSGDTLWFKVYLTDSRSGQLIPRAENVYVNLIDETGVSTFQAILLSVNGQVSGSFVIPENVKTGNFLLQAHTNYLTNFGPNAYFYKYVTISKISGSYRMFVKKTQSENMVTDVVFFPEGGVLLTNSTNLVAFKAVDRYGIGVNVKGKVTDEKGALVTSFSSDFKGMGLFFLTPESGKSYFATIDGFPSFRYPFEPVKEGVKIQLVNITSKEVILNITGNSAALSSEEFYIANMYRGEVIFYQSFKMEGLNKVFKFESSSLKPGINKMILLDKMFNPISERFLFSRNYELNSLNVKTDREVYNKRSEIQLVIDEEETPDSLDFSNLSVSVVHESAIPENGFSKNILSQFLIDSEINGFVESSLDLFQDTEITSEAKLRLLMLTIGSKGYFWNNAPGIMDEVKFSQESGINLKGVAKNTLSNNVIANGEITMAIQKDDEMAFLTQDTDSLGKFLFPGLLFNDTATIHVQAKTEKGKMNVDVLLEPLFHNAVPEETQFGLLQKKVIERTQLAELKYQMFNELRKSQPRLKEKKSRTRGNDITENDGHFRLYESADYVLNVDPFEQSYNNILDYMVGKIPGVDINGDNVRIRGTSSFAGNTTPLFLLDGVPLVGSQSFNLPYEVSQSVDNSETNSNLSEQLIQTIRAIPLSDIDKIEVLKSSQNTAVYGVKGANGVVSIFTKRGEQLGESSSGKGIIEKKIVGYLKYNEFSSPVYSADNINSKPLDLRTLLFWKSGVTAKPGKNQILFFSADQPGKYKVIMEGISNKGKICLGSTEFLVK